MANELQPPRSSKPVAIWLLVGVFMLIVQVLLGGITRLTGSGLSITEWKPIMGAIPPMNEQEWNIAFEKYKHIAQYKYLNAHFTLSDFKSIFFWEWFHRLWARLIGVAAIIPFVIFLIQKRIKRNMVMPLVILIILGGFQGLVGWIMVKSGLNDSERLYVSHYKLAIHFILALGLVCYALWFALKLFVPFSQLSINNGLKKFIIWILPLLTLQLIYGAFMAGLKAAAAAPTWPDMNGHFIPVDVQPFGAREVPGISHLFDNTLLVHFIHRMLGYLVALLIIIWTVKAYKFSSTPLFQKTKIWPLLNVLLQVLLGILTVLNSTRPLHSKSFITLAVAHQFFAMLLLLSLVWMLYIIRSRKSVIN